LSVAALLGAGLVGGLVGASVSRPPKLAVALVASAYADACRIGELFGIRRGMTRREVLRSFGMLDTDFESHWYVRDDAVGLPADQIEAPMWPAGRLPDRLMQAPEWRAVRAGYAAGFEMVITFGDDLVTCADLEIEIPTF